MQIFLLSGERFRRKEEKIKQKMNRAHNWEKEKLPVNGSQPRKCVGKEGKSDVHSQGLQCKVFHGGFYMTELGT